MNWNERTLWIFSSYTGYLENNDLGNDNDYIFDYCIAIYGKPNAGKSTLANSLIGYDRILTSKLAGTTSDIVEDIYKYKNKNFKIIDTAGIFRKNKIDNKSINFEAIRKSLNLQTKTDLIIVLISSSKIKLLLFMIILLIFVIWPSLILKSKSTVLVLGYFFSE